jgi:hypothetical protein
LEFLPQVETRIMIAFEILVAAVVALADALSPPGGSHDPDAHPRPDPARMVAVAAGSLWPQSIRPEWAEMLFAILRNDMLEDGKGWWKSSACRLDWSWLAAKLDQDRSGDLSRSEVPRPELFFEALDTDLAGTITRADLSGEATKPGSGLAAAVFRRLDSDSNDRVSWDELSYFFQDADRAKRGWIAREDLERVFAKRGPASESMPSRTRFFEMLLRGELGSFRPGPSIGATAPDFDLPRREGKGRVRLSSHRGKRPVVLIFGSFT